MYGGELVSLDAKGRMAIPTKMRDGLQPEKVGQLYITVHAFDPCLVLYTQEEWLQEADFYNRMPARELKVRTLRRRILGQAASVSLDSAGRILLPQRLRDVAKLEKKVMFSGMGARAEIWCEELWNQYQADDEGVPEDGTHDALDQHHY